MSRPAVVARSLGSAERERLESNIAFHVRIACSSSTSDQVLSLYASSFACDLLKPRHRATGQLVE